MRVSPLSLSLSRSSSPSLSPPSFSMLAARASAVHKSSRRASFYPLVTLVPSHFSLRARSPPSLLLLSSPRGRRGTRDAINRRNRAETSERNAAAAAVCVCVRVCCWLQRCRRDMRGGSGCAPLSDAIARIFEFNNDLWSWNWNLSIVYIVILYYNTIGQCSPEVKNFFGTRTLRVVQRCIYTNAVDLASLFNWRQFMKAMPPTPILE